MKLWLLRHARVLVEPGVCYGFTDLACDIKETQAAAEAFSRNPAQKSLLWTSSSQRACQLAYALQGIRPDLRGPVVDDRLREMNFGQWEMQPWNEIPRAEFDAWLADFSHYRFGGQESTQEVIDRVSNALEEARSTGESEIIWVTHAGVIKAVQFLLSKTRTQKSVTVAEWPSDAVALGSWICF